MHSRAALHQQLAAAAAEVHRDRVYTNRPQCLVALGTWAVGFAREAGTPRAVLCCLRPCVHLQDLFVGNKLVRAPFHTLVRNRASLAARDGTAQWVHYTTSLSLSLSLSLLSHTAVMQHAVANPKCTNSMRGKALRTRDRTRESAASFASRRPRPLSSRVARLSHLLHSLFNT